MLLWDLTRPKNIENKLAKIGLAIAISKSRSLQSGGERRCGWSEANPLLIAASGSQADSELGPTIILIFPLGQTVQQTLASQCRRFELCTMRCAVSMQCMQVWLTLQAEEM